MNEERKPLTPRLPAPDEKIPTMSGDRPSPAYPGAYPGMQTPYDYAYPGPLETVAKTREIAAQSSIDKIVEAVAGVMAEVGVVAKEGVNQFFKYKYATIGDIAARVTPLMGKHGLMVTQNEVDKKIDGRHIMVVYEFTVAHKSGQIWPEKLRYTGMAIAVDSKGGWDDKCINKCATAARKYFLISFFNIPTSDEPDADQDGSPPPTRAAVPSRQAPAPAERTQSARAASPPSPPPSPPPQIRIPTRHEAPRLIPREKMTTTGWSKIFRAHILLAKTEDEVRAWDTLNNETLQLVASKNKEEYDEIYQDMTTAIEYLAGMDERTKGMPDPASRPDEACNWIAQQFMTFRTYEAMETWFNSTVAPRQDEFVPNDWTAVIEEYQRTEKRLAPDGELPNDG